MPFYTYFDPRSQRWLPTKQLTQLLNTHFVKPPRQHGKKQLSLWLNNKKYSFVRCVRMRYGLITHFLHTFNRLFTCSELWKSYYLIIVHPSPDHSDAASGIISSAEKTASLPSETLKASSRLTGIGASSLYAPNSPQMACISPTYASRKRKWTQQEWKPDWSQLPIAFRAGSWMPVMWCIL